MQPNQIKLQSNLLVNTCQKCGKLKCKTYTEKGRKTAQLIADANGNCRCS